MHCPLHEHAELVFNGPRAFYRPRGVISASLLVDLLCYVLLDVRAKGRSEALINISAVTGFESPDPSFRRWAVKRWAAAAAGSVRVALVMKGDLICPERTGVHTAAEEGFHAHVCSDEREALEWLDVWHKLL
ncbi:MAG: hypothetical protein ACAH88_16975 [Roseimicrobium sp.]